MKALLTKTKRLPRSHSSPSPKSPARLLPFAAAVFALMVFGIPDATAQTGGGIISDVFSGNNKQPVSGRTPDTANLPGGTWTVSAFNANGSFNPYVGTASGHPAPMAYLSCAGNSKGAAGIRLSSGGYYVKPLTISISADLAVYKGVAYVGLGFYSAMPVAAQGDMVTSRFSGLRMTVDANNSGSNGTLTLFQNGVAGTSVGFTGTFDINAMHKLSYDVNTSTGAISNVCLEGSTSDYSVFTSTAFTDAGTAFAAVGVLYTFGRDNFAYADNFLVSARSAGPPDDASPFGVSSSGSQTSQFNNWIPQMSQIGVKWARLFGEWGNAEPSQGAWNFTFNDAMLSAAESGGIKVSGLLLYSAPWVNTNTHTFPLANIAAWRNYVTAMVSRYGNRVKYWEVWNEPESFSNGGTPADYAAVVVAAYDAAKAANPNCQIGLTFAENDVNWMKKTIVAGAADKFDYVAVHPYSVLYTMNQGWEGAYLGIVRSIRRMLAEVNPSKANVPIWFTELGQGVTGSVTETEQAINLVKAYSMGIAQGVARITWYEAKDGDAGPFGLLTGAGIPRPSYTAMGTLIQHLGANPAYLGWVLLNNKSHAFVFQGAANTVLVAWAPPNVTDPVTFGQNVLIVDPLSGGSASGSSYDLTNSPRLFVGVPAGLVSQAQANKIQPFPWNGNFSGALSVNIQMGGPNVETGLHMRNASAFPLANVGGVWARDASAATANAYMADPNFASYTPRNLTVSVTVQAKPSGNAGFNLWYESANGWKSVGWYGIPKNGQWTTITIPVTDAEFVGIWGYNFRFESDSTANSNYYIRSVTVTTP